VPDYCSSSENLTSRAGTGNGTLNPLSIERGFYNQIAAIFDFPEFFSGIVEKVISSIHGVIASFLEDKDGQKFLRTRRSASPSQLLILDINF
jgi:hypothetical protein